MSHCDTNSRGTAVTSSETLKDLAFSTREDNKEKVHLGLDLGQTWEPPSCVKAQKLAESATFHNGRAPILDTSLKQLEELGSGVVTYFLLLRKLAVGFTIMSLFSIPAIYLCLSGMFMSDQGHVDFFHMLTLTLGNINLYMDGKLPIGSNALDAIQALKRDVCVNCLQALKVKGGVWELSPDQVGGVLSTIVIGYCLIFISLVAHLFYTARDTSRYSRASIEASDYCVSVFGLPESASELGIRKHFSDNFDPKRVGSITEDGRPHREGVFAEVTRSVLRKGSWVPGKPASTHISGLHSAKGINRQGTSELTPQSPPPPSIKSQLGESSFSSITLSGRSELNYAINYSAKSSRSGMKRLNEMLHNLSKPLPVVDITFPGNTAYLGGWVAEVSVAGNLGEALRSYLNTERSYARLRLLKARIQKFSPGTPYICRRWRWAFGPFETVSGESHSKRIRYTKQAEKLENAIQRRQHSIIHSLHSVGPVGTKCCGIAFVLFNNQKSQQLCLQAYKGSQWPMERLTQPQHLRFHDASGRSYPLKVEQGPNPCNIIWENLHVSLLERKLFGLSKFNKSVIGGGPANSNEQSTGDAAVDDQTTDQSTFQGTLGSIVNVGAALDLPMTGGLISIVIMNYILRLLIQQLAKLERPDKLSVAELSLSKKVFVSEFINTALVILFSTGRLNQLLDEGFSYQVYTSVGQDVIYAVIYLGTIPHILQLLRFFVWMPLQKWTWQQSVSTQDEMNKLFAGPQFKLGDRYAELLLILFVSMMYAGGMPILLPCAAFAFWVMYFCDWYLLLRHYSKPVKYDEHLAQSFCAVLPYALIIHTIASILAYGNGLILPATSQLKFMSMGTSAMNRILLNLATHVQIYMLVMFILILLCFSPFIAHTIFDFGGKRAAVQPKETKLRSDLAGKIIYPRYTDTYFQVVDPARRLTGEQWNLEKEMGVYQTENGIVFRTWETTGYHHGGIPHTGGQKRNTWESVGKDYSYRVTSMSRYKDASIAICNDLLEHPIRKEKKVEEFPRGGNNEAISTPVEDIEDPDIY